MVVIPGPVEFAMGSPTTEVGRQDYEPQHKKRIGRRFALAAKSVTVEQYRQFEKGYPLPTGLTRTAELPVVGNVFTWCQESYKAYPKANEAEASDDRHDGLVVISTSRRVLRGGSFISQASNVRSADRHHNVPANRVNSVGFRVAKTFAP